MPVGRPKKKNPSAADKAARKWYKKNRAFKNKRAASRNKARRKMGSPKGKEIHHKNGNANDNRRSNLAVAGKSHGRKHYSRKKRTPMSYAQGYH